METRNVTVTLKKAKEWYNSGNATLKEVALQAFTEEELKYNYKNIIALGDVYEALSLDRRGAKSNITGLSYDNQLMAIYDVNNICKALNGDWEPSLVSGSIYYPWVKFFPANSVPTNRKSDITNYFMYDGVKYALVGGDFFDYRSVSVISMGVTVIVMPTLVSSVANPERLHYIYQGTLPKKSSLHVMQVNLATK